MLEKCATFICISSITEGQAISFQIENSLTGFTLGLSSFINVIVKVVTHPSPRYILALYPWRVLLSKLSILRAMKTKVVIDRS